MSDSKNTEIKAIAKGIRISPRKVAVVADLVRRRSVADALTILSHTERKSAGPIAKCINSAVANAKHNSRLSVEELQNLEIKTIMVTDGGVLKRYKMVGYGRRGRPRPILKRSSHLTVILESPITKKEVKKESKTVETSSKPKTTAKAPVKKEAKK